MFIKEEFERLIVPGPGNEYFGYMHRLGFNDFWANAYWAAHWVRPSVGNLNEALYRGIITPDVWAREVRLNDYAPYAIPWLQKIIYQPYTRVDIRRMWDLGLVDDEEVYENYKWLGYDDEHASRMLLWTKAYVVSADVRAMYSKGWIDENGAKIMLIQAGVPEDRVDTFMRRLVKVSQTDRMATERDLTKTDILRLVKTSIITLAQATSMLKDLGYDDNEASYLIALQLYQPEIELKELTQAQILKAYRLEVMTRGQAKTALLNEGYGESAVETLLKLEDINLADNKVVKQAERDLSRTDIVKAIALEIITKEVGYQYLAYLGYSDWEIQVIFALEGIT